MKGTVIRWVDDKGFGFIKPDDGSKELFFHISKVKTNARKPKVGDSVLFRSSLDSQKRLQAENVIIEGVSQGTPRKATRNMSRIEPPKKDAIDYILIAFALISLLVTALKFYSLGTLEASWPYSIPAMIAVILIINREKIPKSKEYSCSRCHSLNTFNKRTIAAWNQGYTKLYCNACHTQWLQDRPDLKNTPINGQQQRQGSGCLSALVLALTVPAIGVTSIYQLFF